MATGTFTHTTLQNLVDQLAQDLGDTGKTFFTTTELQRAIVETLRLLNALVAHTRSTIHFNCSAGTAWYNLDSLASAALAPTVTDRTSIEDMQYRLMETVEPSAGAGMKEQFTFAQLLRALQQSRDRYLVETEQDVTKRAAQSNLDEVTGTVDLDEAIATVRRVVWTGMNGRRTILRNSSDEGTMVAKVLDRRVTYGTPRRWAMVLQPQLTLQLDPIPDSLAALSSLELWTVEAGATLSTTANSNAGTVLGIHDDLAAGPVWDALAFVLMKHSLGHNPARAQFADRMGTLYRALGRSLPAVLEVAVNGVDVRTGLVEQLDARDVSWESATRGIPRRAVILGSYLGLYPVPDDEHSVTVTLASKLTVPALTDYVQVGKEHLRAILAWAKQLVLFKVGGNPLAAAAEHAGLLIESARAWNDRRIAACQNLSEILSTGLTTQAAVVRSAPPQDLAGDPVDDASSRNARNRNPAYSPYTKPIGGR